MANETIAKQNPFAALGSFGHAASWAKTAAAAVGLSAPAPAPQKAAAVETATTEIRRQYLKNPEAAQLLALKEEALANARTAAQAAGRQPSLIDYYIAAEELGAAKGLSSKNWNESIYADMQGMEVKGVIIRESDVAPSPKRRASAMASAVDRANGAPITRLDVLKRMQDQQAIPDNKLPAQGVEALEYLYNLDENLAISPFYTNTQGQSNFKGTVFEECNFHPAGMLMHHEHEGASFDHCTFDGMVDGETVVLKDGSYKNITLVTDGGTLVVGNGTTPTVIESLSLKGSKLTKLDLELVQINKLEAEVGVVEIEASAGSKLSNANFGHTSIYTKGSLRDVTLNNVHFENAFIAEMDLTDSKLTDVYFSKDQLKHLDLSNAVLNNVYVDGVKVTDIGQLGGAITSPRTQIFAHETAVARTEEPAPDTSFKAPLAEPILKASEPTFEARRADPADQPDTAAALDKPIKTSFIGGMADVATLDDAFAAGGGAPAAKDVGFSKPVEQGPSMAYILAQLSGKANA